MKILIFRSGAYGDMIVLTPFIRHLHSQGHKLFVVTGTRGLEVLKNNPHIEKLIPHDESVKNELLGEHIEWLRKKNHCDKTVDFNESIECALSQHPRSPNYKLSKQERMARFNRNFYEYAFEHANEPWQWDFGAKTANLKPELFFCQSEIEDAKRYIKPGFNILLGMSGSGTNKTYPWNEQVCEAITRQFPDAHIITTGDYKCKLIEPEMERVTNLSGEITMRTAMCLTGLVDLVISPDTGLLHASGCYDTPKIGLLGHNTIECITKYFTNDFSIEADQTKAECSPCLFMIYNMKLQCPLSLETGGSICMSDGIPYEKVVERFREVYVQAKEARV